MEGQFWVPPQTAVMLALSARAMEEELLVGQLSEGAEEGLHEAT